MNSDNARELYQRFVQKVQEGYQTDKVKDGVFQAMMEVSLINDGPVCRLYVFSSSLIDSPIGDLRDVNGPTSKIVKKGARVLKDGLRRIQRYL
jgi:hypothetical protein